MNNNFSTNSENFTKMNQFWLLMKKYDSDVGDDEYFNNMVKEFQEFSNSGEKKELWKQLAVGFLTYKNNQ